MTVEELKNFDGKDGKKAYVAYKNVVYDVTGSPLWQGGEHQGMHSAGEDLTLALQAAPHAEEVFENLPVVGDLEENSPDKNASLERKKHLQELYQKYHPHPMTVHFPIALHIFAAFMDIVFFISPQNAYAVTVFYSFTAATLMGAVAIVPGVFSWWINYGFSKHYIFVVKLIVAVITVMLGIVAIGIYLESSIYEYTLESYMYHFIVLFTGGSVILLGYLGGKITWGNQMQTTDETVAFEQTGETFDDMEEKEKNSRSQAYENELSNAVKISADVRKEAQDTTSFSLSILIGGAAGSGIDSLEKILSQAFKASGYFVFSTKEYMSRVRGGSNTTLIRVGDAPLYAPVWEVDIAVALDALSLEHMQERFTQNTLVFADESLNAKDSNIIAIAAKESAKKFGNVRYENTYMAGVLFGLLNMQQDALTRSIGEHFKEAGANRDVAQAGYKEGSKITSPTLTNLPQVYSDAVKKFHLLDGSSACGFGFLAGGCDMITAYPMSPSTGVLNFMAKMSKEFDIAVEQSEDEIASLMMTLGGWFAGARAMTSTSGGGFALMGEALSLSGMTETPAVIYLAQRPGPATGLPTRSEQGDLNMVIHSGHGPFARAVLAPGSLDECIECGYLAFELADRFQIPVIVMSDQYLADSIAMVENIDFSTYEQRRYIQKSTKEYERYAYTHNGITPRAVPGYGEGILCTTGDEHEENGQITESHKVRDAMVAKRAKKKEALTLEALAPTCKGDGDIAVVGWGSTLGAIDEALQRLGNERLVHVHFSWVYPLSPEQLAVFENYKYVIVVENNADGAFSDQLKLHGIKVDKQVLQSNGFSFFADQLETMLTDTLKELL